MRPSETIQSARFKNQIIKSLSAGEPRQGHFIFYEPGEVKDDYKKRSARRMLNLLGEYDLNRIMRWRLDQGFELKGLARIVAVSIITLYKWDVGPERAMALEGGVVIDSLLN